MEKYDKRDYYVAFVGDKAKRYSEFVPCGEVEEYKRKFGVDKLRDGDGMKYLCPSP